MPGGAGPGTSSRAPTSCRTSASTTRSAPRPRCSTCRRSTSTESRGKDAARLLDHVVTRDVQALKVGQVAYTPWCDARRQGARRRHHRAPRRDDVPHDRGRAQPALAAGQRGGPRRDDRGRLDIDRRAFASGTGIAQHSGTPWRAFPVEIFPPGGGHAARDSGLDLAHRLHRRPWLRALGRCEQRLAALGCADGGRHAARHQCPRACSRSTWRASRPA